MDSIAELISNLGKKAKKASRSLRTMDTETKNAVLNNIASNIQKNQKAILDANKQDLIQGRSDGLDDALLDRLMLNSERINDIVEGLEQVVSLPDPIGEITDLEYRPSGIQVGKNEGAHRGYGNDLRISSKCHYRCSSSMFEIR